MLKEIVILKEKDWSLNLEDPWYAEHREEIIPESISAVRQTKPGRYVNIVTPEQCGDAREWLIGPLSQQLEEHGVAVRDIRYIDQCGCGGYVIRVYR